jgi:hypothetical protein
MNYQESLIKKCLQCGYLWKTRILKRPRLCPRCKTSAWDKTEPRKKYNFGQLWVGRKMVLPWNSKPDGRPDFEANKRQLSAIGSYASRTGRKFVTRSTPKGLEVERLL